MVDTRIYLLTYSPLPPPKQLTQCITGTEREVQYCTVLLWPSTVSHVCWLLWPCARSFLPDDAAGQHLLLLWYYDGSKICIEIYSIYSSRYIYIYIYIILDSRNEGHEALNDTDMRDEYALTDHICVPQKVTCLSGYKY